MEPQKWIDLKPGSEATRLVLDWWRQLKDNELCGDRAHLRRCSSAMEVLLEPAYYRLWRRLGQHGRADRRRMAFVVGLLAHVKVNTAEEDEAGGGMPEAMARPKGQEGTPRVSDLRFRRLLKHDRETDPDMLYGAFIRMIRLLDGQVNVPDLITAAYWWNERVKQDWAFRYYDSLPQN